MSGKESAWKKHCSTWLRLGSLTMHDCLTGHFVLENVQTGEKYGFACLSELLNYLAQTSKLNDKSLEEERMGEVQG
jgi:hypothetical protein